MLLGDVEGARAAFRKAIQSDAAYAPAHLENGLLLVQRQDIAEGVRELERYIAAVDATDPDAGVPQVQALIDQLQRSTTTGRTASEADEERTTVSQREGEV